MEWMQLLLVLASKLEFTAGDATSWSNLSVASNIIKNNFRCINYFISS